MTDYETPLRTQRKTQSRAKFFEAARELFSVDGYEATTMDAIASRAGLHVQTLYRHFPTKTEMVAALWEDSVLRFETFLSEYNGDTISAWRDWVELNAKEAVKQGVPTRQMLWGAPAVAVKVLQHWHHYEELLAEGIAKDMKVDPADDQRPIMIACMLWGMNVHTHVEWVKRGKGDAADYVAAIVGVADAVREQFQHQLTE